MAHPSHEHKYSQPRLLLVSMDGLFISYKIFSCKATIGRKILESKKNCFILVINQKLCHERQLLAIKNCKGKKVVLYSLFL